MCVTCRASTPPALFAAVINAPFPYGAAACSKPASEQKPATKSAELTASDLLRSLTGLKPGHYNVKSGCVWPQETTWPSSEEPVQN